MLYRYFTGDGAQDLAVCQADLWPLSGPILFKYIVSLLLPKVEMKLFQENSYMSKK